MVDLGEPREIVTQADAYVSDGQLPNPAVDGYSDDELETFLRDGSATPAAFLENLVRVPLTLHAPTGASFPGIDASLFSPEDG